MSGRTREAGFTLRRLISMARDAPGGSREEQQNYSDAFAILAGLGRPDIIIRLSSGKTDGVKLAAVNAIGWMEGASRGDSARAAEALGMDALALHSFVRAGLYDDAERIARAGGDERRLLEISSLRRLDSAKHANR